MSHNGDNTYQIDFFSKKESKAKIRGKRGSFMEVTQQHHQPILDHLREFKQGLIESIVDNGKRYKSQLGSYEPLTRNDQQLKEGKSVEESNIPILDKGYFE